MEQAGFPGIVLGLLALLGGAGCISTPTPTTPTECRTEARWCSAPGLDGRIQSSFEHGRFLVWGTVEGPRLRRGAVLGHAAIEVRDAQGAVWRELRALYREPVSSDPPSAAAVFCASLEERPPDDWRLFVEHHPRVLDAP